MPCGLLLRAILIRVAAFTLLFAFSGRVVATFFIPILPLLHADNAANYALVELIGVVSGGICDAALHYLSVNHRSAAQKVGDDVTSQS